MKLKTEKTYQHQRKSGETKQIINCLSKNLQRK